MNVRHIPFLTAGILLAMVSTNALAVSTADRFGNPSSVLLIQDKKSETVTEKVKRIWRDWTGYKFDVGCPAFPIILTHATCTATGKDREEARAKCQSKNPFCLVSNAQK
jgi:hypothetical protein